MTRFRQTRFCCFCTLAILATLSLVTGCDTPPDEVAQQMDYKPPSYSGIAYVQSECDHIAVANLADHRVSRIKLDRILAGIALSDSKTLLHAASKDGHLIEVDLQSGRKSDWSHVTESISAIALNDQVVYLLDDGSKKVIQYDLAQKKVVKELSLTRPVSTLSYSKANNVVYLSSSSTSIVTGHDGGTLEEVFKLENSGNSIHKVTHDPNSDSLWIAEGNEFKDGKPYGIGYSKIQAQAGGINVIHPKDRSRDDFVYVGGNVMDLQFSPDFKQILTASSRMPDHFEASLAIVDTGSRRTMVEYRLCHACHVPKGVELDDEHITISSLQTDWNATSFGKATTAAQN